MLRNCYLMVDLYYVHRLVEPDANDPDLVKDFLDDYHVVLIKDESDFFREYPNEYKDPKDFIELKNIINADRRITMCVYFEEGNIVDFYNDLKDLDFCAMYSMDTFKKIGLVNGSEIFYLSIDAESG